MAGAGTPPEPTVGLLCSFPAGSTEEAEAELGTAGGGSSSVSGSLSGMGSMVLLLGKALGVGLGVKQPGQGGWAELGVGTEPPCPAGPVLVLGWAGSGEPRGPFAGRKGAAGDDCGLSEVKTTLGEAWGL